MAGRILNGVKWSAIERFSVQIVQFVVSMILARLLTPEMFGVVAIALVLINILRTINETGFSDALVQKQNRDDLDYSTIFVLNISVGTFLYLLLFILAPYLSQLFKNEDLVTIIRLLGLNLIITSFMVVQRSQLIIKVDFKKLGKASFLSCLISGLLGVYCAYIGMGVMSIVVQSLVSSFLSTLYICLINKWKLSLNFSKQRFVGLFGYAYKLILARLINVIFNEMYTFVIGLFYSPALLGLFNRAKSYEKLATNNITSIVQRVSIPILCEQQNDYNQMTCSLLKFIRFTAFIVYPLIFFIFVLAKPLIVFLLTDKWIGCVWMLRVLCPVGILYLISTFNLNIFDAIGRTDLALKTEIYKKTVIFLIMLISISISFEALVWSQIIVAIIEFYIDAYFVKKQIHLTVINQITNVLPIFLASLIMSIFVALVSSLFIEPFLQLLFGLIVGIITYVCACYLLKIPEFFRIIANLK